MGGDGAEVVWISQGGVNYKARIEEVCEHKGVASLLLAFTVDDPRQPDDPLNSNKDRYLTVFFASRPDGDK
jgi:hypothetical protein